MATIEPLLNVEPSKTSHVYVELPWSATDGDPVCPRCGSLASYELSDNRRFKCADCRHKFSVTSGTIFASRKLPIRDILAAIAIFVNGAKGYPALQLSRDLNVQYKTAFVMAHKLREVIGAGLAEGVKGDGERLAVRRNL